MKKAFHFVFSNNFSKLVIMTTIPLILLTVLGCGSNIDRHRTMTKVELIKQEGPTVVNIYSDKSLGSGVIYNVKNGYGYIITNDHVTGTARNFNIRLKDKRILKGEKIGSDSRKDIAVIKVEGEDLMTADFGDSAKVEIGTDVVAIGNALGSENSSTDGSISSVNVDMNDVNGKNFNRYLQTSAPINPGNSGGALFDMKGYVIGINDMTIKDADNVSFAIPSNEVTKIVDQLINKGYIPWPYLGIDVKVNHNLTKDKSPVLSVNKVMDNSPAAKAGLREKDIIIKVNKEQVANIAELRKIFNNSGTGSIVEIYYARPSKQGYQYETKHIELKAIPKGFVSDEWS